MTHYIGMSGHRGCLPDHCAVYDTHSDAVEGLSETLELDEGKRATLDGCSYVELSLATHGAEYAEIERCECSDPSAHEP